MKKITWIFLGGILPILSACDLQPKIVALPDTVGEFISSRYPALLADPVTQPEIYNSAATDYGVYASPELYGRDGTTDTSKDDYVMYASVNDYTMPAAEVDVPATGDGAADETVVVTTHDADVTDATASDDYLTVPMYGTIKTDVSTKEIKVVAGDTLYKLARANDTTVEELAKLNNLSAPYNLSVGQTLRVAVKTESVVDKPLVVPPRKVAAAVPAHVKAAAPTKVAVKEVRVAAGDTLYSMSRKYSIPVNDLAVMNNLSAPFTLSVGQTLRVPDLAVARQASPAGQATPAGQAAIAKDATKADSVAPVKVVAKASTKADAPVAAQAQPAAEKPKISSDPKKKLPKIGARSSSKFAWPVRGRVLSHYGAKGNGLFNDGINIAAARGTSVKAAENGAVAYAGNEVKGMGNLVIVQHAGGWMTVYAHMDTMSVRRGASVKVGQKIGTVGATGKVDEPQLHFEIRKGTKAYNPESYLKK